MLTSPPPHHSSQHPPPPDSNQQITSTLANAQSPPPPTPASRPSPELSAKKASSSIPHIAPAPTQHTANSSSPASASTLNMTPNRPAAISRPQAAAVPSQAEDLPRTIPTPVHYTQIDSRLQQVEQAIINTLGTRQTATPLPTPSTTDPEEAVTDDPNWRDGNLIVFAGDTRFRVPDFLLFWSSPEMARIWKGKSLIRLDVDAQTFRLLLTLADTLNLDTTPPVAVLASLFRLLDRWQCLVLQRRAYECLQIAMRNLVMHPLKILHLGFAVDSRIIRSFALGCLAAGNIGEQLYQDFDGGNPFSPSNWRLSLWRTFSVFPDGVWALQYVTNRGLAPIDAFPQAFELAYSTAREQRDPLQD
ncbi:hypothetical protein CC85DRAFT_301204 [Cutaneotrichosporon oleaginosum]|uniref:BTB domain-containing protein n=1 Tax=Cutaneotrichosporon oleaginosum TaxID=879819 RepID=A0A0J1B798_9TREE|nr:uncharacterized protein CC85DRAFT_301204 [Cutaneotrichosporon oleaginosum]KLT43599.1 hypothetical protein CC85DRAFT_301204 [Cutaneotrichosporon oleaginosum]TXT12733.1 hypothetical protein COLE_03143 [Cutaneotrichosporon oleaginosum]